MNPLQKELRCLSDNLLDMWELVASQVDNTCIALLQFDKHLANEVIAKEKRIDAFELSIDNECETLIALKNPFAADLRFVLAMLKINYNLERIGDFAHAICLLIIDIQAPVDKELLSRLRIPEMFKTCQEMLTVASDALHAEDGKLARSIFEKDRVLNQINTEAPNMVYQLIKEKPEHTRVLLDLLTTVRRLERVGDHMTNIVEEIIFYLEAKKLMHKKYKKKVAQ